MYASRTESSSSAAVQEKAGYMYIQMDMEMYMEDAGCISVFLCVPVT